MYFHYFNCYLVCTTCTGCTWTPCHLNLLLFHRFGEYCLNCMPVELGLVCVKLFIPDGVDEEPYWAMILNVHELQLQLQLQLQL